VTCTWTFGTHELLWLDEYFFLINDLDCHFLLSALCSLPSPVVGVGSPRDPQSRGLSYNTRLKMVPSILTVTLESNPFGSLPYSLR